MSKRNRIKNNRERDSRKGRPSLSLSSYDPVTIEIPFVEITEEEIDEQIRATAAMFPDYVPITDRSAQPQDYLLVSMTSSTEDGPLENLSYQRQRIALADEHIPPFLKEELMKAAPGDTRTVDYDAPTGEGSGSGGIEQVRVRSTFTVHEVLRENEPEITDAWVETYIPGARTVEEFRERVRKQMEGKANAYYEEMKYTQCASALAARLEGGISDDLFEQGISAARQELETSLKKRGISKEEYLKKQGLSEEQLSIQLMMKGRQMIAEGMALEAMAEHLELRIDDADIRAVFGRGVTEQQAENMRASYEKAGKLNELYRMAACGKALEHVVAHAQVTHTKPHDTTLNPFA